jgi:hypothetical protein
MFKQPFSTLFGAALLGSTLFGSTAALANPHVYVHTTTTRAAFLPPRPVHAPTVIVRPAQPSVQHVWIEGSWDWNGYGWAWTPGYWQAQYAPQAVYVQRVQPQRPIFYAAPVVRHHVVTPARPVARTVATSPPRVSSAPRRPSR